MLRKLAVLRHWGLQAVQSSTVGGRFAWSSLSAPRMTSQTHFLREHRHASSQSHAGITRTDNALQPLWQHHDSGMPTARLNDRDTLASHHDQPQYIQRRVCREPPQSSCLHCDPNTVLGDAVCRLYELQRHRRFSTVRAPHITTQSSGLRLRSALTSRHSLLSNNRQQPLAW